MFTEGFKKTAKYDEREEYEKANEVERKLSPLPHPAKAKAGDRVAYYSTDRGWKEGPWAKHTKGCSVDEEIDEQREQWKKDELKKNKLPDDFKKIKGDGMKAKQDLFRKITGEAHKKFPMHHHGKNWNKEAIGIGDLGTVVKVEKPVHGADEAYHVSWDKHPNCTWGGYRPHDLKTPHEGM